MFLVAAVNGELSEATQVPIAMFDLMPPGKYADSGDYLRIGDAFPYVEHLSRFYKLLLEMADLAQARPVRGLVLDRILSRLMLHQPDTQIDEHLDLRTDKPKLLRTRIGSWRGHPVYLDSRFQEGRGCAVTHNGKVAAHIRTCNLDAFKVRMS